MKHPARLFNCAHCQRQTIICRECDRGNIYCGPMCASMARKVSLRAANQRYQKSRRGQHQHAERQKRYRLSHRKIVTYHTSKPLLFHDLLLPTINGTSDNTEHISITSDNRCYFCGNFINIRIFHELY